MSTAVTVSIACSVVGSLLLTALVYYLCSVKKLYKKICRKKSSDKPPESGDAYAMSPYDMPTEYDEIPAETGMGRERSRRTQNRYSETPINPNKTANHQPPQLPPLREGASFVNSKEDVEMEENELYNLRKNEEEVDMVDNDLYRRNADAAETTEDPVQFEENLLYNRGKLGKSDSQEDVDMVENELYKQHKESDKNGKTSAAESEALDTEENALCKPSSLAVGNLGNGGTYLPVGRSQVRDRDSDPMLMEDNLLYKTSAAVTASGDSNYLPVKEFKGKADGGETLLTKNVLATDGVESVGDKAETGNSNYLPVKTFKAKSDDKEALVSGVKESKSRTEVCESNYLPVRKTGESNYLPVRKTTESNYLPVKGSSQEGSNYLPVKSFKGANPDNSQKDPEQEDDTDSYSTSTQVQKKENNEVSNYLPVTGFKNEFPESVDEKTAQEDDTDSYSTSSQVEKKAKNNEASNYLPVTGFKNEFPENADEKTAQEDDTDSYSTSAQVGKQ